MPALFVSGCVCPQAKEFLPGRPYVNLVQRSRVLFVWLWSFNLKCGGIGGFSLGLTTPSCCGWFKTEFLKFLGAPSVTRCLNVSALVVTLC